MTAVRITHIGGPTTLIEAAGWRLLTDPTFDPPGRRYRFGWGTSSRKVAGPAVAAADVGPVDAVLLTHDHHGDNLDDAGRALLPASSRLSPWWSWVSSTASTGPTSAAATAGPATLRDDVPQPNR